MSKYQSLALTGLCLAIASTFAPQAQAQIILAPTPDAVCGSITPGLGAPTPDWPNGLPPLCDEIMPDGDPPSATSVVQNGLTCGFDRGSTNCTANDFVGNAQVTSNTISDCHKGDVLDHQALSFTIKSASSDRYGVGLFIAEQGQNLKASGGTCSVATFPTASTNPLPARNPYPWHAQTAGDICGSYLPNSTSIEQVDGLKFVCNPDVNNNPQVNFMVIYANNAAGAKPGAGGCNGPQDVHSTNAAKCSAGGTPITNVVVTYNANPTCAGQMIYDPATQTITATFTVTNSGPDEAGPNGSGSVTFQDIVPAPATVTNVTCGTPTNNAVCGTVGFTGNTVSGTISSMPANSSVKITITATVPPGQTVLQGDGFTLSVNGTVVTVPDPWNNVCPVSAQLPVRLEKFDVK